MPYPKVTRSDMPDLYGPTKLPALAKTKKKKKKKPLTKKKKTDKVKK